MNHNLQKYLTIIGITLIFIPVTASADGWFGGQKKGVASVTNKLYIAECSACHYAFQPGLLPARSWKKLLNNLGDHFGEDAGLAPEEVSQLIKYATDNAADKSNYKRSVKINKSIKENTTPLRITETGYIIKKHRELSKRHVQDNPKVKSLSSCEACHTRIDSGSFSEKEIKIPGFGRWED